MAVIFEEQLYQNRVGNSSARAIYFAVLIFVVSCLVALPFVSVNVNIKSPGVLRSASPRADLFSPGTGAISDLRMRENQYVRRGDTLLLIDTSLPRQKIYASHLRLNLLGQLSDDIRAIRGMLRTGGYEEKGIRSLRYKSLWGQFKIGGEKLRNRIESCERRLNRYNYLLKSNALTLAEFEEAELDHQQAILELGAYVRQFAANLESDLTTFEEEIRQLNLQVTDYHHVIRNSVLVTTVSGTLQDIRDLTKGAYVTAGTKLAAISRDSPLIAECFVDPEDAGLLKSGQSATIRIAGIGASHRASFKATVAEIGDDVVMANDRPVIRVRCLVDTDTVRKAGIDGQFLRKGVAFTASLHLTRRTLLQLLSGHIENWIAGYNA